MSYKKDYCKSRKIEEWDWVWCEICWITAVDIHHIYSSHRGVRSHQQDWSDLIALCRKHHNEIHSMNDGMMRSVLQEIIYTRLAIINSKTDANSAINKLTTILPVIK